MVEKKKATWSLSLKQCIVFFSSTGGSSALKQCWQKSCCSPKVKRNAHLKICARHSQNDWLTRTNGALCKLIWFHKASAVFYSWMHDNNKIKNGCYLDCRSHYRGFVCFFFFFYPLRCGRHSTGHIIKCSKISAGKHLVV